MARKRKLNLGRCEAWAEENDLVSCGWASKNQMKRLNNENDDILPTFPSEETGVQSLLDV